MLPRFTSLILISALTLEGISAAARPPRTSSPAETRRKVEKLGVGQHVMVKTLRGQELHGHILKVDPHTFTLRPDHGAQTEIAYADVLKIRKNPGPIVWMLIGAALVIIIIVAVR